MKSSVVDLYILHSDANEPERPEKDSIVDTFYANMTNMIAEVMSSNPMLEIVTGMMVEAAIGMADVPIGSMTEDETSDAEFELYQPHRRPDACAATECPHQFRGGGAGRSIGSYAHVVRHAGTADHAGCARYAGDRKWKSENRKIDIDI